MFFTPVYAIISVIQPSENSRNSVKFVSSVVLFPVRVIDMLTVLSVLVFVI